MAENDVNIKLLIEAEDRSRAALDQARANTRSLVDQQKALWRQVSEADNAEISGNKDKALSAEKYFETRKKAAGLSEEINKGYRREESALAQLTKDHDAHAKGVERANQQKIKSTNAVGGALSHYIKHFASVAAAEEVIRRSISEYAEWERGMARIEIQTGKNSGELEHFGHTIDGLARLTGISVGDLQKNFMTFQAGIGEMNHDVEKAFVDVVRASHAGGVSVDVMARTAVAALKTMQVPYSELRGMLDQVVKVIPASAMAAWDAAGPKILGVMRSIGHSGSESVGQAALAFSQLTQSLGSSAAAGNVQLEMLKKGTDQSSFFGKVMTPQLIELQKTQAGATKTGEAYYQQMEKLGIFDKEDPGRALFMQQKYGFSDEMVRGVEDYHKLFLQIEEEHKKAAGSKTWSEVERAVTRLNQGPKAAIDQLTGSLGELLVSLGKFLGPSIPTTLTMYVNALNDGINRLDAGFAKLREATGSRKPAEKDEHGNVIKPAEETPWVFDPAGWIVSLLGGGTLAEQRKHAETAPGFSFGKAGFGLEDALFQFLLGEDDPAHKRRQLELQEKREREGPQEEAPWGRTRVAPAPKPQPSQTPAHRPVGPGHGAARPDSEPRPGYAIGGEFKVEGQGGRDTQPVSFMATPGERVAVTTPTQESLQQQQDKADIAMREHFARFHGSAFTKTSAAAWWPGGAARQVGPGPGGAIPGGSQGGGAPTTTAPGAPAPGGDGKVAPSSATSTAPAGSVPATLPGSVASLGPEPGKFTPVPDLMTASGTSGGEGGGGGLATDRAKFARELAANPALREKIMRIAQNEQGGNPQGTQAVIESMMNRASYGGRTLAQEARWTGEGGYYAQGSMGRNMTAAQRAVIENSLDATLKGGNVSNYATDNASGDFARRRLANDMYRQTNYINGEYFSTPGQNPRGPGMGNFNKYQAWLEKMRAGDAAAPAEAKQSAVTIAKTTPNPNAELPPGAFDPNLTKLPEATPGAGVSMPATGPGSPISGTLWQGVGAHRGAYSNIGAHTHAGQDIGAPLGTPIHAEGEGVVVKNEFQPGAVGGIVTVKYKDGTTAKYMHLSNWQQEGIKPGATVKPGQIVGLAGASPGAPRSGVHLHVEYRDQNGKLVRPEVRHGWGATNEKGEGLYGRVVHAGIPGSFPAGTTREAALAATGGSRTAAAPTNVKIATVKPNDAPTLEPSLLTPPTVAPPTPPVRTAAVTPAPHVHGPGDGHAHPPTPPGTPPAGYRALLGPAAAAPAATPGRVTVTDATPAPGRVTVTDADEPEPEARQGGGTARAGRPYMVGEGGPELFKPNMPGNIFPHGMMPPIPDMSAMFAGGMPGGFDFSGALAQFRELASEISKPLQPSMEMPRAGPMRQRMSRRVEAQRERDVSRMTRHAAHSDIGMG